MLEVRDLHVNYGAISALHGISLEVKQNEIVTLIGANGAWKSTLVKALSGLVGAEAGQITVRGRLAQVPEGREVFAALSVDDPCVGRQRLASPRPERTEAACLLRRRPHRQQW